MAVSRSSIEILLLLVFISSLNVTLAEKKTYIVYMGAHSHGNNPTASDILRATDSHLTFLASYLGSDDDAKNAVIYSYNKQINGFAAVLEEEHAAEIAKHPAVVSVFLSKAKKLHTTHSWDFMLLENKGVISTRWSSQSRFGEDTIIGNLDSGVWPESKSFSDEGYGAIPSRWKGACKGGPNFSCNKKLIGARFLLKGYLAYANNTNSSELHTTRDFGGHGTHTLSTAGGNFVSKVSVNGLGSGTAVGGSPRARVAAYKVCGPEIPSVGECFDSDILAGFDAALHDGVDVISVSLGGDPEDYFEDSTAIGAFHAVRKGVVVACSAGNSGPKPGSVENLAPWIITVAASTTDRAFEGVVQLGNGKRFNGTTLSKALEGGKSYPLITGGQAKLKNSTEEDSMMCLPGTLDATKAKGKIVVCLRGVSARVDKGYQAQLAGGVGMILCNDEASGNELIADAHVLPASMVTYSDGVVIYSYINSTSNPVGTLEAPKTVYKTKPSPFMASFSSQGPNPLTPHILKPDITAPGVDIVAAYTEANSPTGEEIDERRFSYNVESGTSMSCPHIAGVAGLLKTAHPDWSPAAIHSAIMTSARTRANTHTPMVDGSYHHANPFNYGSGHVRPSRAMDPGLVYDAGVNDYLNFLCALGYNQTMLHPFVNGNTTYKCPSSASVYNLNYPSIAIPNLKVGESVVVTRTLKNVGRPATYGSVIRSPRGMRISLDQQFLEFDHVGDEATFKLTIKAEKKVEGYVYGGLTWSDGTHYVRSPIVVSTV